MKEYRYFLVVDKKNKVRTLVMGTLKPKPEGTDQALEVTLETYVDLLTAGVSSNE